MSNRITRRTAIGSTLAAGLAASSAARGKDTKVNKPAWDSKYTDNINTEMNYWPAGVANLSECQLPLVDAIKDLSQSGASVTAVASAS